VKAEEGEERRRTSFDDIKFLGSSEEGVGEGKLAVLVLLSYGEEWDELESQNKRGLVRRQKLEADEESRSSPPRKVQLRSSPR